MKTRLATFAASLAALSASAAPTVSNVQMTQPDFASSVTITYDLADEPAIVTFDIVTNGVSIGAANVVKAVGDVNRKIQPGTGRTITWSAYDAWPDHKITNSCVQAVVTAWALDNPPPVMVVDLMHKSNIVFYASIDQLPGGVMNDVYKTEQLVMRKIPARGSVFTMGATVVENSSGTGVSRPHRVAFTNDFYLGVYEVTQGQLFNVCGVRGTSNYADHPNADILPCDGIGFGRTGSQTQLNIRDWHANPYSDPQGKVNFSLASDSVLRKFAHFTGICFDAPTGAQWEFACRAGTAARFNDGSMDDAALDALGWYAGNSTNEATNAAEPHPVGMKKPNAFGLYDMHGNVWEWVLDYVWTAKYAADTDYDIEPFGPTAHDSHTKERHGGGFTSTADDCRITGRSGIYVNNTAPGSYQCGLRLWAPAKMW